MYHSTTSNSSASSDNALTPTQQRLLARVKEVQMFAALERQADEFSNELENLSKQTDLLSDGSKAIGAALQNWHAVFRTTSIALSALAERGSTAPSGSNQHGQTEFPEQLVRIPVQEGRNESEEQKDALR